MVLMQARIIRPHISKHNYEKVKSITGVIRGDFNEALTVLLKEVCKRKKIDYERESA